LKRFAVHVGLVWGGLCAAVVVVELGLRVFPIWRVAGEVRVADGTAPHAQFGWFNVPGASFAYRTAYVNFGTPVRFNSKGLREREYSYEKANGVFRVLVLGDSFTASLEVPFEQVWHERLERALNEGYDDGRPVEVIGAGVQGWSTDQQLLFYRYEGYKYDADLVVVQFYWDDVRSNDIDLLALRNPNYRLLKPFFALAGDRLELKNFPYAHREPERPQSSGKPYARARGVLRQYSATYRFLRDWVVSRRRGQPTPFCYRFSGVPVELFLYAPEDPPEYRKAWALTARLLEELRREVVQRGKRFAVVYFPDRRQVLPRAWEDTLACWPEARARRWDLDRPNRVLARTLQRLGVPYLDLTSQLRAYVTRVDRSVFYELDGHLNEDGHVQVAEAVRRWLVDGGLVPR
jgi:lysophospholipase L1-like esterase